MASSVLPIGPKTAEAGEAIHPTVIILDLGQARDDVQFGVAGNLFYAIDANDDESTLDVKFEDPNRQPIPVLKGTRFRFSPRTPFRKLFVSNSVQPGKTITFLVAGPDTFDIDIRQLLAIRTVIEPVKSNVIIGVETQNNQVTASPSASTLLRSVPANKIEEIRLFVRGAFNLFVAFGAVAGITQYQIPSAEERIFVVKGPLDVNGRADGTGTEVRILAVPLN